MLDRDFGFGAGFDTSGKKWDVNEFFHEAKRLSGIPVQEGPNEVNWGRVANFAAIIQTVGRDLQGAISKRDVSEAGWLAANLHEAVESFVKVMGMHVPSQEVVQRVKEERDVK